MKDRNLTYEDTVSDEDIKAELYSDYKAELYYNSKKKRTVIEV